MNSHLWSSEKRWSFYDPSESTMGLEMNSEQHHMQELWRGLGF